MTSKIEANQGFTLIELMVSIAIGLIGILIMLQMALFFDSQKKTSTGGADAQNTGMIAMHTVSNDIRLAGYGLATLDNLNCTMVSSRAFNGQRYQPLVIIPDGMTAADATNPLAIPPGDAGTDIIAVMYGNGLTSNEGTEISQFAGTTQYGLATPGFNLGDFVMAAQAGRNCTIGQITAPNPIASPITIDQARPSANYYAPNAARLFNLGPRGMSMNVYAIRNGNLTVCNFWINNCSDTTQTGNTAIWVPIANNVISMRAQYGWDTSAPADMTADAFCRSRLTSAAPTCPTTDDGFSPNGSPPTTACDWTRITSLRIALVTRSTQKNPNNLDVSPANLVLWPESTVTPTTTSPLFNVPDRKYRHHVFQTTIPVRNVIWFGAQASC